uniref:Alpha-L-arabinofuranosidase B arabinose-binding domain-containing protein n=1 Tax=Araucaria cunninghamii TaxID=56994 RepID=A0A0D6R5B9_ARACU
MATPTFGALLFIFSALIQGFLCKECTNSPSELSSHTFRHKLLSSKNKTWQKSVFSSDKYLIPLENSVQSGLHPMRMLRQQEKQVGAENELSQYGGGNSPPYGKKYLHEISLHKVRLDADSEYGKAQQANLEYLLMLDTDSLVWSFRKTAGLDTPGSPYGGWEGPDVELRGHFLGHYMSAAALMWASTHNEQLWHKMQAIVNALYECQHKMGTGYLSAFPSELFDRFESIQPVWAPYYTIHKIMAGLVDQYTLAGNVQAYKMAIWMADYFYNRVQNVIMKYTIERHWHSLNEETGGMNEVLYRLYTLTGNKKHLQLAHLFDKPCFLGMLAVKADSISGFHANTHIPVVIGSQMRYEVTGDPLYKEIATYFMEIVNSSHSYATGGTSAGEFWYDPKRLGSTLGTEDEESCTTYNMLKVARHLFRWTKAMTYADYYERALINGVLSIQRVETPGVMIYMLPQGPGNSKAVSYHGWGTPFDSFWCCYGTGIESFSKLGDSIYFQEGGDFPILYIVQFISSTLTWDKAGLIIKQTVKPLSSWDPYLRIYVEFFKLKDLGQKNMKSIVNIRIPLWTTLSGAKVTLNDEKLLLPDPGNFLTIAREWEAQDKLSLFFPVPIRTERIKDDRLKFASVQAILFGPYVLAGMTYGDWDLSVKNENSFSEWVTAVPNSYSSHLFSFCQEGKISESLVPDNNTLVFSQSNDGIFMKPFPVAGTNNATNATFRIIELIPDPRIREVIKRDMASIMDYVGSEVYLEPFAFPGMLVVHNGVDNPLSIISRPNFIDGDEHCSAGICIPHLPELDAVFKVLPGLDGQNDSVSFESASLPNCFLYGATGNLVGQAVQLSCKPSLVDREFKHATSFIANAGIAKYHPISFIARGTKRAYLLSPLMAFRDESYTVYFNITSG